MGRHADSTSIERVFERSQATCAAKKILGTRTRHMESRSIYLASKRRELHLAEMPIFLQVAIIFGLYARLGTLLYILI